MKGKVWQHGRAQMTQVSVYMGRPRWRRDRASVNTALVTSSCAEQTTKGQTQSFHETDTVTCKTSYDQLKIFSFGICKIKFGTWNLL